MTRTAESIALVNRRALADRPVAAVPAVKAADAAPAKPIPPLAAGALGFAEMKRNVWYGIAAPGAQPHHYDGAPERWSLANDLRRFDLAEIVGADGDWWAQYLCTTASPGFANAVLLQAVPIANALISQKDRIPAGYNVRPGRPGEFPWVAFRESDDFVLSKDVDLRTQPDAEDWLSKL